MWESVVMKEAEMLGCSMVDGERNVCWEGDGGDETGPLSEVVQNETDINIAKDDRDGGWLFGMEMNVQVVFSPGAENGLKIVAHRF